MGKDNLNASPVKRGVTLNSLKDELYSLHMRLLLAVQNHDTEAQRDLESQIIEVQRQIEGISRKRLINPNIVNTPTKPFITGSSWSG